MENILSIVVENKNLFLFGASILILKLVSYFIYNILKVGVVFPEDKLIESEKILVNSSLRKMISSGGFRFSISKTYLLITNKRIILAFNIFSFWTYKFFMSIWFDKNDSLNEKSRFAENVRLGKNNDSLLFNWKNEKVKIFIKNSSEILEKIGK